MNISRQTVRIISMITFIASIVLTIVCYVTLPDMVVTQIGGDNPTVLPKLTALLIPAILGIGCSIVNFCKEYESRTQNKFLICSVLGIVVYVLTLIIN